MLILLYCSLSIVVIYARDNRFPDSQTSLKSREGEMIKRNNTSRGNFKLWFVLFVSYYRGENIPGNQLSLAFNVYEFYHFQFAFICTLKN